MSRHTAGKKALASERRRVILSARVSKSTLEFINELGQKTSSDNSGRTLDVLVAAIQNSSLRQIIESTGQMPPLTVIGG
jgi:hypothetical protein